MTNDFEVPSDDDIFAFMDAIPRPLTECAAARHKWDPCDTKCFDRNAQLVTDPNLAVAFDIKEVCKACGQHRYHTITFPVPYGKGPRDWDRSEFTYGARNPQVQSPAGVSETGISVRSAMAVRATMNRIVRQVTHLPPTGQTKAALEGTKVRKKTTDRKVA